MLEPKKIEQIAKQIHEALPKGLREFGGEMEKKTKQVLQAQLGKLNMISREEFDVQTQVLLKTREKLTQLEKRFSELEEKLAAKKNKASPTK